MNHILIDNFFDNVEEIRNLSISQTYTKSNQNTGWKGFRANLLDEKIKFDIHDKLISIDQKFKNITFQYYFHYSLDETKNELNDFWRQRFHRDLCDWAGVIYLTPNPKEQTGTIIFDENNKNPITVKNVYNRLIMYKGDTLHGVEDTFGENINDGRMTITMFGMVYDKISKSLI